MSTTVKWMKLTVELTVELRMQAVTAKERAAKAEVVMAEARAILL